jgi:ATP-dependent Clp protease protease subunit
MELLKIKNKIHSEDEMAKSSPKYAEGYIKLTKNRTIFLAEDLTKENGAIIVAMLLYFDAQDPNEEITILINCNGGDASALMSIYDVMQMISAPVKTVCLSKCYSAAAVLLSTGAKGKRFALKHSQIMIHGLQCTFPLIGESDHVGSENYFNFLNKSNLDVMRLLSKHTGKNIKQVEKDCSRDFYLTPEAALKYGIIDRIL